MAQQYKLWILIESRVVKQKRTRMQNNGCCYKTRSTWETQQKYCICKNETLDLCIEEFNWKIKEGPYCICCICNRTLYKKSVLKLNTTSYPSQDIFNILLSFDGKERICKTCHSKVNQGSLPFQARVNNLYVDNISTNSSSVHCIWKTIVKPKG